MLNIWMMAATAQACGTFKPLRSASPLAVAVACESEHEYNAILNNWSADWTHLLALDDNTAALRIEAFSLR